MSLSDLQFLLPAPVRAVLKPAYQKVFPPRPVFIGYLAERSARQVRGWVENVRDRTQRVEVEIYCTSPSGRRLLGSTIAGLRDHALATQGMADPNRGFRFTFDAPLSQAEWESIEVWPVTALRPLETLSPRLHGYTRRVTEEVVIGWLQDATQPDRRLAVEAVVTRGGREVVVGHALADRRDQWLVRTGHPTPECGFRIAFDPPLAAEELAGLKIRAAGSGVGLDLAPAPPVGYVRERALTHVAGWLQDPVEMSRRLAVEAVLKGPGGEQRLATGVADRPDAMLAAVDHPDPQCGFRLVFTPPLTGVDPADIVVRASETGLELEDSLGAMVGYLRARTLRHVEGWVHNPADPGERVAIEVVIARDGAERVVATAMADRYDRVLGALGMGDALHGFRVVFPEPLSPEDHAHLIVRATANGHVVEEAPEIQTEWRPLRYIAMDIVDNCNLRCPFCLFDHAPVHRTNAMTDETFAAAIRLLPFVGPEGHWMSCLHEPSMHPNLTGFLRRIPREHAHVMTYTTNLAKRMPDAYFAALADSGLSNINVSIESRDPAIYERMRKGARYRIFMENWDKMLAAFAKGKAAPRLRYIAMAYKSNYREIPSLIEYLRGERNAWLVEIRDTYDVAHIEQSFRDAEYLERAEWMWLRDALAHYSPLEVVLTLPPGFDDVAVEAAAGDAAVPVLPLETPTPPVITLEQQAEAAPGLIEARIFHDGEMFIYTSPDGNYPNTGVQLAHVNIRDIADPAAFLMEMVARTVE